VRKYQPRNCRDCGFAAWVHSRSGDHGGRRINPFQPGYCQNDGETAATIGDGLKLPLDPQAPLVHCQAWQLVADVVGDQARAA
jgi:hypothetical protein